MDCDLNAQGSSNSDLRVRVVAAEEKHLRGISRLLSEASPMELPSWAIALGARGDIGREIFENEVGQEDLEDVCWTAEKGGEVAGYVELFDSTTKKTIDPFSWNNLREHLSFVSTLRAFLWFSATKSFMKLSENRSENMYVRYLFVDKENRRSGIGTRLVAKIEEQSLRREKRTISLYVDRKNVSALRFYEELGFTEENSRDLWATIASTLMGCVRLTRNVSRQVLTESSKME